MYKKLFLFIVLICLCFIGLCFVAAENENGSAYDNDSYDVVIPPTPPNPPPPPNPSNSNESNHVILDSCPAVPLNETGLGCFGLIIGGLLVFSCLIRRKF